MRAKAIATLGKNLSENSLKSFHHTEENFQLKIGDVYTVYGVNSWSGLIHYLTLDESRTWPSWRPAELFTIIDYRLPSEWYFSFWGYDNQKLDEISAVWGYKELATEPEYYFHLVEGYPEAIEIFNIRRNQIDRFHESLTI